MTTIMTMTDDIVIRLREKYAGQLPICTEAADEIERLRKLSKALYEETRRCGIKHDVKATNDWERYEMGFLHE